MIGIVDYDFSTALRGLPPPSLVAMKISAYYRKKQKNEMCRLVEDLDTLGNYDLVYFISNKIIDEIPPEIFKLENVKFYGAHLPNEIPELIHHMIPDVKLYNEVVQRRLVNDKASTEKALAFLGSIYYQAHVEGKLIPVPPMSPRSRVFLYDKDILGQEDGWDILDKIIAKKPSTINCVEPLQCHSIKQFLKLREDYEKVSRKNKIILDYYVPYEHFDLYFSKYKLKLLGEITSTSDISVYIGKNYFDDNYTDRFYLCNIFYCLNLLCSYFSRNIGVTAEIYHSKFEIQNTYTEIYKVIRSWANTADKTKTLDDCFRTKKQKQIKEQILASNPSFQNFLPCSKNSLAQTRGIWRLI